VKPLLTPYLKERRNRIAARLAHGDILDLGCGSAEILDYIEKRGIYVGVDNNREIVEGLSSQVNTANASFIFRDLDNGGLDLPNAFDTVLLIAVIEHLMTPEHLLEELHDLLKDHGRVVVTTPTPLADRLHGYMSKIGFTHKDAARQHHHLYSRDELVELFSSYGYILFRYKRFELGLNQLFVFHE
jgi:SAM-dependent methyltransferase